MHPVLTRVLTALPLLAGFIAALFWASTAVWVGILLALVFVGAAEWGAIGKLGLFHRLYYALGVGALSLAGMALAWNALALAYLPGAAFWLLAPWLLRRHVPIAPRAVSLALGALLLASTCWAMASLREANPELLLAIVGLVVVADSAAYFSGRRFGKHKLAPAISPGKTWEGAVGAWLAVSLYTALVPQIRADALPSLPLAYWLALAWLLLGLSIVGDLFESWLKRQAGVKDSGTLLPGHGGVLDRIDSLTAVMPVAALIWWWLQ